MISRRVTLSLVSLVSAALIAVSGCASNTDTKNTGDKDPISQNAQQMVQAGQQTFRFDTFGSEVFWGDAIKLHQAIEGEKFGGVGPGLSPKAALGVGLKVDVDALPKNLVEDLKAGKVNLDDPATTLELLKLKAVIGVIGTFDQQNKSLTKVGITCAICHSTVDDSLTAGIGHRLDGWANQDLNPGAIIAFAPNLQPVVDLLKNAPGLKTLDVATLRTVLNSWGQGKYDAEVSHDGKALGPDGKSHPTLIPAAFGLAGVNLHTWNGWGSVTYWNAYVANTQMHGTGTFFDPRLNDPAKYPIAAATGGWNVRSNPDLVTSKLAALHFYQLAIPAPKPPSGSFDAAAATRGKDIFEGKGKCATCHVPPLYTEPGWSMHTAQELGIDDFQASRSPDGMYRTTPLGGLWTHMKRGFYHDGRFATLGDVIDHYNSNFKLGLTADEKADLVEFLKSLPR